MRCKRAILKNRLAEKRRTKARSKTSRSKTAKLRRIIPIMAMKVLVTRTLRTAVIEKTQPGRYFRRVLYDLRPMIRSKDMRGGFYNFTDKKKVQIKGVKKLCQCSNCCSNIRYGMQMSCHFKYRHAVEANHSFSNTLPISYIIFIPLLETRLFTALFRIAPASDIGPGPKSGVPPILPKILPT
jgi:hypothetical protein